MLEDDGTKRRRKGNVTPKKKHARKAEEAAPHPKTRSKSLEEKAQGICEEEDCD